LDEVERTEGTRARRDPLGTTGQVASTISRQLVQLHARLYGRGPTRAKTHVHSDYVLSVLEDIFTPAERTLISAGKGEHVFTTRRAFQEAVQLEFCEIVEAATGREIRAFMSQVHLETQVAVEIFLLEPLPGGRSGEPESEVRADGG
jgi:uncharacterized protein YbcI